MQLAVRTCGLVFRARLTGHPFFGWEAPLAWFALGWLVVTHISFSRGAFAWMLQTPKSMHGPKATNSTYEEGKKRKKSVL
jgi:hypothetical protein